MAMEMLDDECRKQTAAFMEGFRRQMQKHGMDADSELSAIEKRCAERAADLDRMAEMADRKSSELRQLRKALDDVRDNRMVDHESLKAELLPMKCEP